MIGNTKNLKYLAEVFDNIQSTRIATQNRGRALNIQGLGELRYMAPMDILENAEKAAAKAMKQEFKDFSPALYEFVKATPGLGEHTVARLLGAIGNPAVATPYHWEPNPEYDKNLPAGEDNPKKLLVEDDPFYRSVGQLWAFCGHGAVIGHVEKGDQTGLMRKGNPTAKKLVFLLSTAAIKVNGATDKLGRARPCSPYRAIYDARRAATEDRVHAEECKRCGPSGSPAQPGSPWSNAHKHADALRIVGKEILKDLWLVANQELSALELPQAA